MTAHRQIHRHTGRQGVRFTRQRRVPLGNTGEASACCWKGGSLEMRSAPAVTSHWAVSRQSLGSHWAVSRQSLGSHWAVSRQSLGSHWAVSRQSLGSHWAVSRQSLGIGQSLGSQQAVIQPAGLHKESRLLHKESRLLILDSLSGG